VDKRPVRQAKGPRDEFVEPYFKGAKPDAVVVVLKAREPARIMIAIGDKTAARWHLEISLRWVVQYNVYINALNGGACLFACAPTFHSRPACASINITGWQIGCAKKASTLCNAPTHS
jgi:hypothetical protein